MDYVYSLRDGPHTFRVELNLQRRSLNKNVGEVDKDDDLQKLGPPQSAFRPFYTQVK
jgi:hypothetical protein